MRPTSPENVPMQQGLGVRVATAGDLDVVTRTITLAFRDDPVWGPAYASPNGGDALAADVWRIMLEGALRYPWTWLTDGGGAVSVWIPPGGTELSREQEERVETLLVDRLGPAADGVLELLARFEASHPRTEPHYYLSLLGTHPDHRGRGIGMALLADNLARVDAERLPAYLESTNPSNDHRYERLGFRAVGSFTVPADGHVITTMWRPAAD
jgi:GNAT superfamily N-acetyltransferase